MCVKGHNQILLNKVNLIMDVFRAEWVEHNVFGNVLQEALFDRMYQVENVLFLLELKVLCHFVITLIGV